MPVQRCQSGGKQGRKWGEAGKCYACTRSGDGWDCKAATKKALAQATAMGEFERMEDGDLDILVERAEEELKKFWLGIFEVDTWT